MDKFYRNYFPSFLSLCDLGALSLPATCLPIQHNPSFSWQAGLNTTTRQAVKKKIP
jgi:hypothetical protein